MGIDYAYRIELYHVTGQSVVPPHEPEVLYDSIHDLGAAFESAESDRGNANCPAFDFTAMATEETEAFLKPVENPRNVHVVVSEYNNFEPTTEVKRFYGRLLDFPRPTKDADYNIYQFRAVGYLSTYDEVSMVDPVSTGPYRDKYYTDLIEDALTAASHIHGSSITTAALTADAPFTSRLFYPGKHEFGGAYNTTDRITALTSDGTYLYIGVGHWLCRYDPATRESIRLARLQYTGNKYELLDTQFRIKAIEYAAGNIEGWAESTYPNRFYEAAHVKIRFTYAGGSTINLTDANAIINYDRGYLVKSTAREADSYGGPTGTEKAEWFYHDIGEAQPPSNQTMGIPWPVNRTESTLYREAFPNTNFLYVNGIPGNPLGIGYRIFLECAGKCQDMGEITKILRRPNEVGGGPFWVIQVEHNTRYRFTVLPGPATNVYWFTPEQLKPRANIAMPGHRDIKIYYDQSDAEGSATPISVRVERRGAHKGKGNFYWPEILGTVSEDTTLAAFTANIALGESNMPEQYKTAGADTFYRTELVPAFNLQLENVARFANLPVEGYWVENDPQPTTSDQPGPNRLMFNGNQVWIKNESGDLETHGNIYLARDGAKVYCAFNRWKPGEYERFYQIVWGELDGAEFTKVGTDRQAYNYRSRPPREVTGFAHHGGKYQIAVKRVEPRWKNTGIKIIWAAPPQGPDKPADYDGGLVVVCMVTYDKTEYLEPGTRFRVGTTGNPGDKEYLVSECVAIAPREIDNTLHSYDTYGPEGRTYFMAFEIEPYYGTTYTQQAKEEMMGSIEGGYLTIAQGWNIRGEICEAAYNTLTVKHTATAPYMDDFEGGSYDYHEAEWHGQGGQAEMHGRTAIIELEKHNVVDPSILPMVVTLKNGNESFSLADGNLIDITGQVRGETPIPSMDEVYLDREGRWDRDEATLYFNPAYAGMQFDVEYHYYPERFYVEPFVYDGKLHFNEVSEPEMSWTLDPLAVAESPTGAIYRVDAGIWERVTAWPAGVATVATHGEDVYALGATRGALFKYGNEWPGYINVDVGGNDTVDVFQVLTEISKAADMYLGEECGVVRFRHRGTGVSLHALPDVDTFIKATAKETPKYRAVLITYDNGKAYYGPDDVPDDLILRKTIRYATDYGHALLLAKRYYDYYHAGATIYDLTIAREALNLPILGERTVHGNIEGRLLSYLTVPTQTTHGDPSLGPLLSVRLETMPQPLEEGATP